MKTITKRSHASKAAVVALAGMLLFSGTGAARAADTSASIESQIQALLAQLNALKGTGVSTTFTRDLTIGSQGADVTALQNFLASKGFSVAAGATGYFGAQTKAALVSYQAANGIAPAAGYFGPATRAKVNASGSVVTPTPTPTPTPDTTGTLKGGEADLKKYDFRRENTDGAEGENGVEVATAKFDVEGGDIRVERLELTAAATNGSLTKQPWKYFDRLIILADGKQIGSKDVSNRKNWDEVSDGVYRINVTGLKQIVRENKTAELTFAFDISDNIDTANLNQQFTFSVSDNGIRAVDAAGIQQYTGNTSDAVTFGFKAEENGKLLVRSSQDDPEAGILVADDAKESEAYSVFAFDLKNSQNADAVINEITINVADLNSGVTAPDVIRRATLKVGKTTFVGDISASSITFSDMSLTLDGEDEITPTLFVTLARNATATPISFSVTGSDIEAEGATSGDDSIVTGTQTSETHQIAYAGVVTEPVSTSVKVSDPNDASTTTATYTVKFKVTALDEDAYVSMTAGTSSPTGVQFAIEGNTFEGSTSTLLTSTARKSGDFYLVREGKTETFTLTVVLDPTTAGTFYVTANGVRFNSEASFTDSTLFELPKKGYQTDAAYIAN
ncbi:peptidoglycan-binding protein [Patescibacteria group bacterium]|nr:peptidoglycan-binding protein [Patescibacteria group bacterium]MBU1755242.1 peptidoglycan-binding protein [Patescibacteria group bacterium]